MDDEADFWSGIASFFGDFLNSVNASDVLEAADYMDPTSPMAQAGIHSLESNLSQGNYGMAVVDGVGLVLMTGVPGPSDAKRLARAGKLIDAAAARAKEIHKAVPEATQKRTTIAVTKTKEGPIIVSSSERRLRPAQRKMLRENELEGTGDGHAEVTGVNFAKSSGLTPTGTAASRPICSNCQDFLNKNAIEPLSPLKQRR